MPNKKEKFFISTALPYVNSVPHLGFALEIVQADVLARWHRLQGEDVFFLTGTDENSLKNVLAAKKEKLSVRELVDRNAKKFYALKDALNLSFDDFIRTTQRRHIKGAQNLWMACQKDIYKKNYKGLYCVGCEAFLKEDELENGCCPEHRKKPELIEEENYFFKLSKYQEKIKKLIKDARVEIIPQTRKKEILSFINQGLEDICVSRSSKRAQGWGIDVPQDLSQKMWCWFEALGNYITALGYGKASVTFEEFWQRNENKLHVIGKGVVRFHAVYWIGFLLSAGLSLPNKVFVHGYVTSYGQKMSKSLGNVVDPFELVKKYGTDAVRYFLLREISPFEDGDFTQEKFETRYNSDLAKGLGNLVARIITLGEKSKINPAKAGQKSRLRQGFGGQAKINENGFKIIDETQKKYKVALENFNFNEALGAIWELIGFYDRYINKTRPWEKSEKQLELIENLLSALFNIAQFLQPLLPQTSEKIFSQLGVKPKTIKPLKFRVKKSGVLFPKL